MQSHSHINRVSRARSLSSLLELADLRMMLASLYCRGEATLRPDSSLVPDGDLLGWKAGTVALLIQSRSVELV